MPNLQVNEGTQIRLMRMLFRALPVGSQLLAKHVDFIEQLDVGAKMGTYARMLQRCNIKRDNDIHDIHVNQLDWILVRCL